ncbi:MAG: BolA family protein [Gammaproteobacteria bacterium]
MCRSPGSRSQRVSPAEIEHLIMQGLPASEARVHSEDGTHFEALVVAAAFAGKRPVVRHQMVYATLGGRLGGDIHALSLRTLTPDEWQSQSAA